MNELPNGPWEKGYQPSCKSKSKSYMELYRKIADSEWFKKAYQGKELGPWIIEEFPNPIEFGGIKDAALALVDAVERYTRQECLRSELMIKKDKLKELIGNK